MIYFENRGFHCIVTMLRCTWKALQMGFQASYFRGWNQHPNFMANFELEIYGTIGQFEHLIHEFRALAVYVFFLSKYGFL